jgi:hypothetical protein
MRYQVLAVDYDGTLAPIASEHEAVSMPLCDLFQNGGQGSARRAPWGPEVDEHGYRQTLLNKLVVKIGVDHG